MLQFPLNITPLCLSLPLLKKNIKPQIPTCINSPYRGHRKKPLTISFGKEVRLKTQNIYSSTTA